MAEKGPFEEMRSVKSFREKRGRANVKVSRQSVPSRNTSKGFVKGTRSPMSGKRLLRTYQYINPSSPANTVSFDEEICGKAYPSLSPSSRTDEVDLFFTVKEEMQKRSRGSSKQAWTSSFLDQHTAKKPLKRSHSANIIFLEAAGRHISLQKHPLGNSKGDSGPMMRPFTAIGLCRSISRKPSHQKISCRTSSEPVLQDKVATLGYQAHADSLTVCGNALGRGTETLIPEMTPKYPHPPTEGKSKTAVSARAVKEPLPLLVGSSTHFFSKKLMKVCSSEARCPPRLPCTPCQTRPSRTACSQTLSRPVANAVVNG